MRILVYGINYYPEPVGIGKYTGEMAAWLARRGHQVKVVCAPPYYPHWRIVPGYSACRWRRETHAGVGVWRCPVWVPRRPSASRRILHLLAFALGSAPVALAQIRWRPDVVLMIEPPLLCSPIGLLTARLSGAKPWLHIQDFELDAAFELGLLSSLRMRRLLGGMERRVQARFARISTISQAMLARLGETHKDPSRRLLFPNWVDTDAIFPQREADNPYRRSLGIPSTATVALYSGNMGHKQGLEVLAEAARLLLDRADIQLVFCGAGAGREDLERSGGSLPNVRFLDLQPADRLNRLLNLADVHLLPQRADVADLVMPSKLTGMLASGIPVLATARPGTDVARLVEGRGLVVPPANPTCLASALRCLADHPDLRRRLGAAGREHAVRHLSRDRVLGRFEEQLERLVADAPGDRSRIARP
jgi:colanic acid biosynthesis glycosyl transferase WcaI